MELNNIMNLLNEVQRNSSNQSSTMERVYSELINSIKELAQSNRALAEAIHSNGIRKD